MLRGDRQFGAEFNPVDPLLDLLKRVGAVYTNDHFVYTSGLHGSVYVNKDAMYLHPMETTMVCRLFAERHQDYDLDVVGPSCWRNNFSSMDGLPFDTT